MSMPKVCVLILNRDRRDDTLACLASLRRQRLREIDRARPAGR